MPEQFQVAALRDGKLQIQIALTDGDLVLQKTITPRLAGGRLVIHAGLSARQLSGRVSRDVSGGGKFLQMIRERAAQRLALAPRYVGKMQ